MSSKTEQVAPKTVVVQNPNAFPVVIGTGTGARDFLRVPPGMHEMATDVVVKVRSQLAEYGIRALSPLEV